MKVSTITPAMPEAPSAVAMQAMPVPGEKLEKVCDQFEGMLLRQILQQGLKPLLGTPPGSGAAGAGIYDYLVTDTLANAVTGKNAMGISHLLQNQLTPPVPHPKPAIAD